MCGIFGAVGSFYKGIDNLDLSLLAHRGPDAKSFCEFKNNNVILAHTRLAIIDINERSNQPMHSSCGRYTIIYNGEIYNFLSLMEDLISIGIDFRTKSDTEVILNGFIKYGYKFFQRLNGMFAIAIHDNLDNKTIIIRDPKGIKPLYIVKNNDGMIFSSEIKPIIKYMNINISYNEDVLIRHLAYNFSPGEKTLFKIINKLLPGRIVTFHNKKILKNKLNFDKKYQITNTRFKNISTELSQQLNLAIKRQVISDAKLGCFLSGGLDSSTIVYFASKNRPDIETFCIRGEWEKNQPKDTDVYYAQSVADHLKVKLNFVDVCPKIFFSHLKFMIYSLEEPICDPAAISTYLISRAAKERGIKVLLSGIGGDEAFAGYRRHMIGRYYNFFSSLPIDISLKLIKKFIKITDINFFSRRFRRLLNIVDNKEKIDFIKLFQWQDINVLENVLNNDLKKYINSNFFKESLKYDSNLYSSNLRKIMSVDTNYFLPDHNLSYSDKMSMSCGVEIRVPLIDNELTNYMSNIPDNYLWRWSHGKWILKKTMEQFLPKNIIYRKKVGFGLPLHNWIKDSKHSYIYDSLKSKKFKDRLIFDEKGVDKLISNSRNDLEEASLLLFSIQCIEHWFEIFIDENQNKLFNNPRAF